jgi:hypothetical protein
MAASREEKADARWSAFLEKQEVKIGLLNANVTVKKREKDLVLLVADTATMDSETRVWYNEQHTMIFQEMAVAPAASSTPAATLALEEEAPSTTVI